MDDESFQEAIEHRDILLDIRLLLSNPAGQRFFKYLFKHFQVGELPEMGLDGVLLADTLGFLRAGNSVFKLVAEANTEVAGRLLAENEKDKYDRLRKQSEDRIIGD